MGVRTAAKWSTHVEAWKQSGLSGAAYARREGLSPVTFCAWRRRLTQAQQPALKVVEVRTIPAGLSSPFRLELNNVRVEVNADFDAEALHRLLGVLERAP